MSQHDFAYAPSSTHRNSDGLRARFARVNPDWNKRPKHMESRADAYARISRTDDTPEPIWIDSRAVRPTNVTEIPRKGRRT